MPDQSFGYVPTPAIVAPIEFTLPRETYAQLGGHLGAVTPLDAVVEEFKSAARHTSARNDNPWPLQQQGKG